MMNVLAIGLVITSLLTAAVWSPSPPTTHHDNNDHSEVIVKEGHRTVVVEYDKETDGNTKVVISPSDDHEEKASEGILSGPRELVCDAYGKCKHKIASALGKTKDRVEETAHGVSDKAQEVKEHAKEAANEAVERTSHGVNEVKDKAKGTVAQGVDKAKGTVAQGVDKAKKFAGDVAGTVKGVESNVTGKVEETVEGTVESVKKAGEKSLGEILGKLKDVGNDIVWYVVSPDKLKAVVGLVHMLGFSTAYGMCVWVTFISSYVLGRYLPRQQFGVVQSRIYPVYFKAMAYSVSAALLGHLFSRKGGFLSGVFGFPGLSLVSALLMVLGNMILLEPRATKTMYERMKIQKEEGRGLSGPTIDGMTVPTPRDRPDYATVVRTPAPVVSERPTTNLVAERQDVVRLNEKLKRLNGYSSALNVLTLVALTSHMGHMGQRLHASTR